VRELEIYKSRDLGTALVSGTPAGQSSYLLAVFHRYRKGSGERSRGFAN
jgi:hypothetical protein